MTATTFPAPPFDLVRAEYLGRDATEPLEESVGGEYSTTATWWIPHREHYVTVIATYYLSATAVHPDGDEERLTFDSHEELLDDLEAGDYAPETAPTLLYEIEREDTWIRHSHPNWAKCNDPLEDYRYRTASLEPYGSLARADHSAERLARVRHDWNRYRPSTFPWYQLFGMTA